MNTTTLKRKAQSAREERPTKRPRTDTPVDVFYLLGAAFKEGGLDYQWFIAQILTPYLFDDQGWRSVNKDLRRITLRETARRIANQDRPREDVRARRNDRAQLSVCCLHGLYAEVEACLPKAPYLFLLAQKFPDRSDEVLRYFCRSQEVAMKYGLVDTAQVAGLTDDVTILQRVYDWAGSWAAWTLEDAAAAGRMAVLEYAHLRGAPWNRGGALMNALNIGRTDIAARLLKLGCPTDYLSEGEIPFENKEGLTFAVTKLGYKPTLLDFCEGACRLWDEELFEYILSVGFVLESQNVGACITEITKAGGELERNKPKAERMLQQLLRMPNIDLPSHMYYLVADQAALSLLTSTWLGQLFVANIAIVYKRCTLSELPGSDRWLAFDDEQSWRHAAQWNRSNNPVDQ